MLPQPFGGLRLDASVVIDRRNVGERASVCPRHWHNEAHSLRMASIYHFLLYFLRKFRFTKGSIHRCIKRWASFLAFLGRRFGINYLWYDEKRGKPQQAERPLSRMREFVVAASHIPASASDPILHDVAGATGQPHTISSSRTSPPASIRAESHRDHADPMTGVGIYGNRSSTNLSTHSRASDRLSIIHQTHSPKSLHALIGQTSRFPRAPHRQIGRGPSPSPSGELATFDLELPDGRILQLINSEQVPRYTKEVTVQVDDIITSIKPLSLFAGPAKEHTMKFRLGQRPSFSMYETCMFIRVDI